MLYAYPCELTVDEDSAYVATFPDVPEAITGGKDRAEALEMAADALTTALAGYVHEHWDIPAPGKAGPDQELVPVQPVVAAKLALYSVMTRQRISKVELGRRLGVSEAAVRRLANPDHRSHMSQVQRALDAIGCTVTLDVTAPWQTERPHIGRQAEKESRGARI